MDNGKLTLANGKSTLKNEEKNNIGREKPVSNNGKLELEN